MERIRIILYDPVNTVFVFHTKKVTVFRVMVGTSQGAQGSPSKW